MSSNIFGWSYPPGVTGTEYAIAGPDYERESDVLCDKCNGPMMEQAYRGDRWSTCQDCGESADLQPPEPDPDRAYDEKRDRQMLGIDVPDGAE